MAGELRLLAISDGTGRRGAELAAWLRSLAEAGVDGVQIREKALPDGELLELCREARRQLPGEVKVLVNERLDIALAAGCEGAHLPVDAPPIEALRRRFGPGVWIGKSTHDPEEVAEAAARGADYVTFGPVFATPAKAAYGPPQGLAALRRAAAARVPVIALGGVGPAELGAVAAVGAGGAAGIRAFHDRGSLAALAAERGRAWPAEG